jgi:hypothetical protein
MANKKDTEDYSNEGRKEDIDEKPTVAKRVYSTGLKTVGKALMLPQKANAYLNDKYKEYVPESETKESLRKGLFGKDPDASLERMQKQNDESGKLSYYAKGGSVSARADGCAQRGKTKGRFV